MPNDARLPDFSWKGTAGGTITLRCDNTEDITILVGGSEADVNDLTDTTPAARTGTAGAWVFVIEVPVDRSPSPPLRVCIDDVPVAFGDLYPSQVGATTIADTFTIQHNELTVSFSLAGPPGPSGGGGSLPDGGTTGQVLTKQSNTDGDADWQTVSGGTGLELGETPTTAYRGDRGKAAFDHSQVTGNPHSTTAGQVGADPSGTASAAVSAHAGGTNVHALTAVTGLVTALAGKATPADITAAIAALVDAAPANLDTLREIAEALEDDEDALAALVTVVSGKANTSDLADVATSGSYTDLLDKPSIPAAPTVVASHDWRVYPDGFPDGVSSVVDAQPWPPSSNGPGTSVPVLDSYLVTGGLFSELNVSGGTLRGPSSGGAIGVIPLYVTGPLAGTTRWVYGLDDFTAQGTPDETNVVNLVATNGPMGLVVALFVADVGGSPVTGIRLGADAPSFCFAESESHLLDRLLGRGDRVAIVVDRNTRTWWCEVNGSHEGPTGQVVSAGGGNETATVDGQPVTADGTPGGVAASWSGGFDLGSIIALSTPTKRQQGGNDKFVAGCRWVAVSPTDVDLDTLSTPWGHHSDVLSRVVALERLVVAYGLTEDAESITLNSPDDTTYKVSVPDGGATVSVDPA